MTQHSRLSPSSAARRVACPGSLRLEEQMPPKLESPEADEGNLAHLVAARMLRGLETPLDYPNITKEMIEGAKLYASVIEKATKDCNEYAYNIEETLSILSIHSESFGTPDMWVDTGNHIHVFDYKYGFNPVDPFENWQLIYYAAAVLERQGVLSILVNRVEKDIPVSLWIVQPRDFNQQIKVWNTSSLNLEHYFNRIRETELEALSDNPRLSPSSECTYCSARGLCPALKTQTDSLVLKPAEPDSIGEELKWLKDARKLIEARITGLEVEIEAMLKKGTRVPGWQLEEGVSRRTWSSDTEELIALGDLFGIDIRKPQEVLTPRQAIQAGLPEELVNAKSQRFNTSAKLAEINLKNVKKIFDTSVKKR